MAIQRPTARRPAAPTRQRPGRRAPHPPPRREERAGGRTGGTAGNGILTTATAALLVALLLAEGVTVLDVRGLLRPHMFIGLVLIGPVLLKLGSTGYRFARYYGGARPYREKGPPVIALRLLAPVLVAATVAVIGTGVALMAIGRRSDALLLAHKASFVVWGAVFAIHFLAYLPRVLRSLRADWTAAQRVAVPGAGLRAMLLTAALGGGVAIALAALPLITTWRGGR
jgi:hypothetical protein